MALPGETKEELNKEEVAWKLLEAWDISPDNAVLERHAVYTFKAMWVDEWRKGKLMLAGDAAHLTPPFMGQGMCSGIRDAQNLSWKLDLVLSGKADDSLLDTYTMERKPHNQAVVEAALYLGKMICVTDLASAKARDEAFLTGSVTEFPEFPFLTDGILYQQKSSTYTGKLSFQGEVNYQGKTGLFDDVVGNGWMIISPVEDSSKILSVEQIAFLDRIGAKMIELSSVKKANDHTVIDIDGKYQKYFNRTGLEAVIVRPDYYLFGGIGSLDELPLIVDDLIKQMGKFINTADASIQTL
jgi:3-(3-hydroxy-phenyl)propionate hydroxylase/flavoprotein hydroxylase